MSETTTYATLVADIQSYTEDDSSRLVAEIPAIIARASDRIQMDADLDIFDQTTSVNIGYRTQAQTVPVDYLRVRSIYLQDKGRHLERRSQAYLEALGINVEGVPRYFTETDVGYLVGPLPDQNYRAGLTYIARLASLSVSNPTNWLTKNMPAVMLYACLAEAERILVSPTQAAMWDSEYEKELSRQGIVLRGNGRKDYTPLTSGSRPGMAPTANGGA